MLSLHVAMPQLTDVEKGRICALFDEGYSVSAIARLIGRSKSTVYLWVVRYQEEGDVSRRPRPCGSRATTAQEDTAIVNLSTDNPFLTSKQIRGELGLACSRQTIIRRLNAAGLYARWAAKKEVMSPAQQQLRLQFALEFQNHDLEFWRHVIWTDEKVFQSSLNGRYIVYRRRSRRHSPEYVKPRAISGRFSVTVWGWITMDGVGMLWEIEGSFTGVQYRAILENVMLPSVTARFGGENFRFMHDRSPIHTSRVARNWLQAQNFEIFNWPPKGCDMNPIEHVWAEMTRILNDYPRTPTNRDELSERIHAAWEHLVNQPNYIASLVRNMPHRLAQVIEHGGLFCRY